MNVLSLDFWCTCYSRRRKPPRESYKPKEFKYSIEENVTLKNKKKESTNDPNSHLSPQTNNQNPNIDILPIKISDSPQLNSETKLFSNNKLIEKLHIDTDLTSLNSYEYNENEFEFDLKSSRVSAIVPLSNEKDTFYSLDTPKGIENINKNSPLKISHNDNHTHTNLSTKDLQTINKTPKYDSTKINETLNKFMSHPIPNHQRKTSVDNILSLIKRQIPTTPVNNYYDNNTSLKRVDFDHAKTVTWPSMLHRRNSATEPAILGRDLANNNFSEKRRQSIKKSRILWETQLRNQKEKEIQNKKEVNEEINEEEEEKIKPLSIPSPRTPPNQVSLSVPFPNLISHTPKHTSVLETIESSSKLKLRTNHLNNINNKTISNINPNNRYTKTKLNYIGDPIVPIGTPTKDTPSKKKLNYMGDPILPIPVIKTPTPITKTLQDNKDKNKTPKKMKNFINNVKRKITFSNLKHSVNF